jgi:ABC-type nitrate/sulfonate/bicarbonate transport system substrate-binding protein
MDTVVVREETLREKRDLLRAFLAASRRGWEENFKNPKTYPTQLTDMMTSKTGRTIDNEIYFNIEQKPLIDTPKGIFSVTDEGIEENIKSLYEVGLKATRDMFVTDLTAHLPG